MQPKTTRKDTPANEAIPQLVEAYGGQLFGLALYLCKNRADAEDLVQETFLLAFQKWEQFEHRSAPMTWLYIIAVRVCRRYRRKRSHEPPELESISELTGPSHGWAFDPPSNIEDPEHKALRGELNDAVKMAIDKLPRHFRLPLILKDMIGFSIDEVAQIMGSKKATVKTRVHRARLFIAKELSTKLPRKQVPLAARDRQMCLDLLLAKQEALDHSADFPLTTECLCSRCQAFFQTLDLGRDTCRQVLEGSMPLVLKNELKRRFGQ